MRSRLLLPLVLVLGFSATSRAQDAPKPRLVTKVFAVADLVIPIPDRVKLGGERLAKPEPAQSLLSDKLIEQVTSTVRPYSWNSRGGAGKIEFFATGYALTVTNTPDAVAEVRDLLEALRRLQDTNITFEVRVLTVPADAPLAGCPTKQSEAAFLTDAQLTTLLKAVQADRRTNVMQAPKMTLFDGQEADVRITETQFFVTGVEAQRVDGKAVLVPKKTLVELGTTFTLRGQLSADKRFVAVNASYLNTSVEPDVETIPITTQITPVFEGGSQGHPVPVTQFLQVPRIASMKIEKKDLRIPSGGHVAIAGPVFLQESRTESGVPVLAQIPYVSRLFHSVGVKSMMRTVLVVSPRVIQPVDEAPMPRAVSRGAVTEILVSWNNKIAHLPDATKTAQTIPGIVGQLFLYGPDYKPAPAQGKVIVDLFNATESGEPVKLASWTFDKGALQKLVFMDERFGKSYRLFLPWPEKKPDVKRVQIKVQYVPEHGSTLYTLGSFTFESTPALEAPTKSVIHLRNVAAADVAQAVNAHLKGSVAVADPVSNSLLISAKPEQRDRAVELATALDVKSPEVRVSMMVMQAPARFVEDVGIAERLEAKNEWLLTEREVRMFTAAIRQAKSRDLVDILSRPTLCVADNQTGHAQVGTGDNGVSVRLTPRIQPDGKVRLRVETQVATPAPKGGSNNETMEATFAIPDSGTLVFRGPAMKGADRKASELLYVMTVHVVK